MERPRKRRRILSPDTDLDELRARNNAKLKTTFESIFEKYGRDFSGIGDEIDLETGKILVNNGHLLGMTDEKDAGADGCMFDELGTQPQSESIYVGKEANNQNDQSTGPAQELADRVVGDVSWLSDDADSLMGDVIVDNSPLAVGSGIQELRLPDFDLRSGGSPPSATGHDHRTPFTLARSDIDLNTANTRSQQDVKAKFIESPVIGPAWPTPPRTRSASGPRVQPTPSAVSTVYAKSERFLSPQRLSLCTSTDKRPHGHSPKWTHEEENLLLNLLSHKTLEYAKIRELFRERFPRRSAKAISDHWNSSSRDDTWRRVLQSRNVKRSRRKRPSCETNGVNASSTIRGDQRLHHSGRNDGLNDLLTTDGHIVRNSGEEARSNESSSKQSTRSEPAIQNDYQTSNTSHSDTEPNIDHLSHRLQGHRLYLSTLSKSSTIEQNVRISAVQEAHRSIRFGRTEDPPRGDLGKLDSRISIKPITMSEEANPAGERKRDEPAKLNMCSKLKAKSDIRETSNIVAAAMTKSISRDNIQVPNDHRNQATLTQGPSAALIQNLRGPSYSTPLLDLLRPKALSTPRTVLLVDRKKRQKTLLTRSADRQVPRSSKTSTFPKRVLPSEEETPPRSSGPSGGARRKSNVARRDFAQVARGKSAGNSKRASTTSTSTPGQKSLSNSVRADEASRAAESSHPAKTGTSIFKTHPSPQEKCHAKGVELATTKPVSLLDVELSDDELSAPIKTVGSPSVSKIISPTLKHPRKTLLWKTPIGDHRILPTAAGDNSAIL